MTFAHPRNLWAVALQAQYELYHRLLSLCPPILSASLIPPHCLLGAKSRSIPGVVPNPAAPLLHWVCLHPTDPVSSWQPASSLNLTRHLTLLPGHLCWICHKAVTAGVLRPLRRNKLLDKECDTTKMHQSSSRWAPFSVSCMGEAHLRDGTRRSLISAPHHLQDWSSPAALGGLTSTQTPLASPHIGFLNLEASIAPKAPRAPSLGTSRIQSLLPWGYNTAVAANGPRHAIPCPRSRPPTTEQTHMSLGCSHSSAPNPCLEVKALPRRCSPPPPRRPWAPAKPDFLPCGNRCSVRPRSPPPPPPAGIRPRPPNGREQLAV